MSEAIKPTPGPWKVSFTRFSHIESSHGAVVAICQKLNSLVTLQDNARLIAEAGTVHHETGLTPRQLVERVKEMEEVARALVAYDEAEHEDHVLLMLDYANMLYAARAALSKSLPNTVAEPSQ